MYLNNLSISLYKNLKELSLNFSPKINSITGVNGAGKSNILDAIYYLSMCKSYFSGSESEQIAYGEEGSYVAGEYLREDGSVELISLTLNRGGGKSLKRNDKSYRRLSEHLGLIPIVMVSPYDHSLINDSAEERRRFVNGILSQLDREYLRRIQSYNSLLASRNKLLKEERIDEDLLSTYSERMCYNANYIYQKRGELAEALLPIVKKYYTFISGGKEEVTIAYRSDLDNNSLENLLSESAERERVLKFTQVGVQRDDFLFDMDGYRIRASASQGQQKSFLLALKLAQFEFMKEIYHKTPILLLDDLFDKLDIGRTGALLQLLSSDQFGQIFITDSNKVRISELLESIGEESITFEISEGALL